MVNSPRTNIDPQDEVKVVAVPDPAVLVDLVDLVDVKVDRVDVKVDRVDVKVDREDAKVVPAVLEVQADLVGVKEVQADLGSAVLEVQEDVKVVQADQVALLLFPQILIACSSMQ